MCINIRIFHWRRRYPAPLPGRKEMFGPLSGGSASLHHRLISGALPALTEKQYQPNLSSTLYIRLSAHCADNLMYKVELREVSVSLGEFETGK